MHLSGREHFVSARHVRSHDAPVVAQAGDRAKLVREDPDAPEWVWVEHERNGSGGWAPKAFLEVVRDQNVATFRCDYDAIELSVEIGQPLKVGPTIAGWSWCRTAGGDEGWGPTDKLSPRVERVSW